MARALEPFIKVQAFEDKELNERFRLGGYPTLVFIDSGTEKPLPRFVGYRTPTPFIEEVFKVYRKLNIEIPQER